MTPVRLERAWSFVAHCLGDRPLDPEGPDLEAVALLARRHGLGPIMGEPRLSAVDVKRLVPDELWARWSGERAAAVAAAVLRQAPFEQALALIAPVPAIVLKGAAYVELIYEVPARHLGDVDLLVPADRFEEALARLERAGFRRAHPNDRVLNHPRYHERQLTGPALELDLHQGFVQPERLTVDYGAVFERSLPWPALAQNARLLAPEDAVVYHAVHAAIGELALPAAPLFGFVDLWKMLARRGPFWRLAEDAPALRPELVPARAREWGAERMLYAVISLARRLFPSLAAPLAALSPPLPLPVRALLDRLVVARAYPPKIENAARPELLLRKALLMRPDRRRRFLFAHALRTLAR